MKKYNYKAHKVQDFKDLEVLETTIKKYGGFLRSDYDRVFSQAKGSKMPKRLTKRVVAQLKPLICPCNDIPKERQLSNSLLTGATDSSIPVRDSAKPFEHDIFNQTYRASEFTIENGYIEIKGIRLYSKRITKRDIASLSSMDHIFKIEKDFSAQDRFRFVPTTDLSILLNTSNYNEHELIDYPDSLNYNYIGINNKYHGYDDIDTGMSLKFVALLARLGTSLDAIAMRFYNGERNEIVDSYELETDGDFILYDLLLAYGMEGGKSGTLYHNTNNLQCNVAIDIRDIEIFDGYIMINIANPRFAHIPWQLFCYMCKDAIMDEYSYDINDFYRLLNQHQDKLQNFIHDHLSSFFCGYQTCNRIRVNTYISAKSFEELLEIYRREAKSNPISYHVDTCDYVNEYTANGYWGKGYLSTKYLRPDQIAIPFSYLTNEVNGGYPALLHLMAAIRKDTEFKNLFTSQLTSYFDDATVTIKNLLSDYHCKSRREEEIKEILMATHRVSFIREVTPYYKNREVKACYLKNQNCMKVFRFYENRDTCICNIPTKEEGQISYLLIDRDKCILRLYPTLSYESAMSFSIASSDQLDTAALALMKFFNSGITNKRMDFKLPDIFKHLGIKSFREIHTSILRDSL